LLWRRLMGTTVLDPQIASTPNLYAYAHCLRNHPHGVALLVINADKQQVREITLVPEAERYTLSAHQLQDKAVQLNGKTLELNSDGDIPAFVGERTRTGSISVAPASITFLAIPDANNSSCR
jgi:heparanase